MALRRLFKPQLEDGGFFIEDTNGNIPRHRLRVNDDWLLSLLYLALVKENFRPQLLLHQSQCFSVTSSLIAFLLAQESSLVSLGLVFVFDHIAMTAWFREKRQTVNYVPL